MSSRARRHLIGLLVCMGVLTSRPSVVCARDAAAKPNPQPNASSSNAATDSSLAGVGAASVPPTTPTEKRAAQLSKIAVGADFEAGRYKASERKLKEAIHICKPELCSTSFQARLHRDLGFIYIAGLEKMDEGKAEFETAIDLDATVVLPFLMQTGAVRKAFADVKERIAKRGSEPPQKPEPEIAKKEEPKTAKKEAPAPAPTKPEPKKESKPKEPPPAKAKPGKDKKKPSDEIEPEDMVLEDEPTPEPQESKSEPTKSESSTKSTSTEDDKPEKSKSIANWLTLSIQQDLVLHGKTDNLCAAGGRYECFDSSGAPIVTSAGAVPGTLPAGASKIAGTTFSRGPVRLLLGAERLLFSDASIGARVGAVLFGKGERLKTDPGFLFLHLEARLTLWLAGNSFTRAGWRPYLYGCGGLGESDGSVSVTYTRSAGAAGVPLNAWKRSGHGFAGAGFGTQFAYEQSRAIYAELNYLSFMSPDVPVIGIQLGYAYGL